MVLIIYTKNALNIVNRYWDMVPDERMLGWRFNLQLFRGINIYETRVIVLDKTSPLNGWRVRTDDNLQEQNSTMTQLKFYHKL